MPWKFVCDLRFHEVSQTTIIRKITKGKEEIGKFIKYSQKPLVLCSNFYVWLVYVCLNGVSSSSCHAACTDIPDLLLPLLLIVHRIWKVFRATSRILTELLYVCSSWSSCFSSAIYGGPLEYIT